jgi:DNA-binding FadR family transcriptional regulator
MSNSDSPDPKRRAFEYVCDFVLMQIARGHLKVGDKLPPERELAQYLAVSRGGVREALRHLESLGLLDLRSNGPKGGAFVRNANFEVLAQVLANMVHLGGLSVHELIEARAMTSEMCVRLFIQSSDVEDLGLLEANIAKLEQLKPDQRREQNEAGMEFHTIIASGTRNRFLKLIVTAMNECLRNLLGVFATSASRADLIRSRRKAIEYIRAKDATRAATELRRQLLVLEMAIVGESAGKMPE